MSDLDLDRLAAFAARLVDKARTMLTRDAAPDIEVKADRSFVTALDRAIEQVLRREIAAEFPTHGIIGEEEGREREGAALQWILDPIDGTAPFIAGVPVYGTLVALARDGVPIIGVQDLPATDDRWIGVAGRPTTRNGRVVRTRSCASLDMAIMACMNPDFFAEHEKPPLEKFRESTRWRIYGTSNLGYGLLASGRVDLCFDTRLQIYDYACFRPIIEGAGGVVCDWNGAPITLETGTQTIAVGDPSLLDAALDISRSAQVKA